MTEDMNRFAFNTEGKICDYGEEEPKVLTEQEILEELNHLENTKNHFWEECEDMNWQNECLQEEVKVLEKALELARADLREMYCSDYCGRKYEEKYCNPLYNKIKVCIRTLEENSIIISRINLMLISFNEKVWDVEVVSAVIP